jgi:hypothetical protein
MPAYKVKELHMPSVTPKFVPKLPAKWEFKHYSGAPPGWIDKDEINTEELAADDTHSTEHKGLFYEASHALDEISSQASM